MPVLGRAADALDLYLRDARRLLMKDPAERALFLTRFGARLRANPLCSRARCAWRAVGDSYWSLKGKGVNVKVNVK